MLLTYPSKESLLRNLNERPIGDVFLIVSNYKSLADWSLIPLKKLSLFLGPNSAGKSIACEVINILRNIDLLDDECIPESSVRNKEDFYSKEIPVEPVIGFSMPYIFDDTLESKEFWHLYSKSGDMARGGDSGEGLGAFFVTEGMLKNSFLNDGLRNIRYTMLYSGSGGQEIYFNDLLASRREGDKWDGEDAYFEFTRAAIENLYKPSVSFRNKKSVTENMFGYAGEYYGSNGELIGDQCFEGRIHKASTDFSLRSKDFPRFIYQKNSGHNFGSTEAALGMFLAVYTVPYLRFMEYIFGDSSGDVRQFTSGPHQVKNDFIFTSSEKSLIISKREGIKERVLLQKGEEPRISPFGNSELLPRVNRWLREKEFLDSQYQLSVDVYLQVPVDAYSSSGEMLGDWSDLIYTIHKAETLTGVIRLIDLEGRSLEVSEVGTGFSQILPIIIGLADGSTLLFKQPEIHLHPRLQSRVSDCFVETISKDREKSCGKARIIETHSEHMVLRLLRRLRESSYDPLLHSSLTLYPEDVAFVYFQPSATGTSIHYIEVLASGEFVEGWPDGFFDERDDDLWGQPSPRGR